MLLCPAESVLYIGTWRTKMETGANLKTVLTVVIPLLVCGVGHAIPNPAAVYCTESGYQYDNGDCVFPDGSRCSAWQFYCKCEPNGTGCAPGAYDCNQPCPELPCKEAGESVLVGHCCEGLEEIAPDYIYDEDCNETGMTGWTYLCSDCGNGICEPWESRCNCPEDCREAPGYPEPAHGSTDVPVDCVLSWMRVMNAVSYDVYLGIHFDDVSEADSVFHSGVEYSNVDVNFCDPCNLEYDTIYYWRVDAVNDTNLWRGDVWSFRTENPITDPNLRLWYRLDETDGNVAYDSSGYGHHGDVNGPEGGWDPNDGFWGGCRIFYDDTAVSVPNDVLGGVSDQITFVIWLKDAFRADADNWVFDAGSGGEFGPYHVQAAVVEESTGHVLWRAGNNTNDVLRWDLYGIGASELEGWHLWAFVKDERADTMSLYFDVVFLRGHAVACLAASKSGVDDKLVNVRDAPFKIGAATWHENDFIGQMDDLRVYNRALSGSEIASIYFPPPPWPYPWGPSPWNGEVDVPYDVNLTWRPGDRALEHRVFFGKTWEDVNSMTDPCAVKALGDESYDPGPMDLDTTYYWQVDEVNEPNIWEGNIWRFTTADFLIVDDMEDYCSGQGCDNHIFETWDDGWLNWTGAMIDLGIDPFQPVHEGAQSMQFQYDNAWPWAEKYSEIDASTTGPRPGNLKVGKDWTAHGVKALTLFFYGDPNNDANETMYVALEDSDYDFATLRYLADMNDIKEAEWHWWPIPLSYFADGGIELTDVNKVYIGFGDRDNPVAGGSGVVYFDDIRLELPKCVWPGPDGDLNSDCLVNYEDLGIMADQWLLAGQCAADLYCDNQVDFKDYAVLARNWLEDTRWPQ